MYDGIYSAARANMPGIHVHITILWWGSANVAAQRMNVEHDQHHLQAERRNWERQQCRGCDGAYSSSELRLNDFGGLTGNFLYFD